jgi:Protein of unknown function (DUF707)
MMTYHADRPHSPKYLSQVMSPRPNPKRPFLVVVRGGEDSLHSVWMKNAPRKWDLLLDHYGPEPDTADESADYVRKGGVTKFLSIKALNEEWPGYLLSYQAIWLVDGDVRVDFGSIDALFEIFSQHGLWLAQPSLASSSFYDHEICVHRPSSILRYVNFVEIMAPLFSRAGLLACLDCFDQSISGWGLDFVWPVLIGEPQRRMAIIDAVQVEHTKKVDLADGSFYRLLRSMGIDPIVEKNAVLEKYGVFPSFQTYGCISK